MYMTISYYEWSFIMTWQFGDGGSGPMTGRHASTPAWHCHVFKGSRGWLKLPGSMWQFNAYEQWPGRPQAISRVKYFEKIENWLAVWLFCFCASAHQPVDILVAPVLGCGETTKQTLPYLVLPTQVSSLSLIVFVGFLFVVDTVGVVLRAQDSS